MRLVLQRGMRLPVQLNRKIFNIFCKMNTPRRTPRKRSHASMSAEEVLVSDATSSNLPSGYAKLKGSSIVCKKDKPKSVKGNTVTVFQSSGGIAICPAGQQQGTLMFSIGSVAQWKTDSGNGCNPFQSVNSYFNYNPFRGNVATGAAYVTPTNVPADDLFCLVKSNVFQQITNTSNVAANVRLYYFEAKGKTTADPVNDWNTGLSNASGSNNQPAEVMATAGTTSTGAVQGYVSTNTVGLGIRDSNVVLQNWTRKKEESFLLGPGACIEVRHTIVHNWIGHADVLNQTTETYCKGSIVCVIFVYGAGIMDTTGGAKIPTTGGCEVAVTNWIRLQFQPVYYNAGREKTLVGSQFVPQGATGANQKTFGIALGPINQAQT